MLSACRARIYDILVGDHIQPEFKTSRRLGLHWKFVARGLPTVNERESRRAKSHFASALKHGYSSIIERYELDLQYQQRIDEEGVTHETLLWWQHYGDLENRANRELPKMTFKERCDRYGAWNLNAPGAGRRNRGASPSTICSGGSNTVKRGYIENPYNANAAAEARRASLRDDNWQRWSAQDWSRFWSARSSEGSSSWAGGGDAWRARDSSDWRDSGSASWHSHKPDTTSPRAYSI